MLDLSGISDVTVHVDSEEDEHLTLQMPNRVDIQSALSDCGAKSLLQAKRMVVHYVSDKVELEFWIEGNKDLTDDLAVLSQMPKWFGGCVVLRV